MYIIDEKNNNGDTRHCLYGTAIIIIIIISIIINLLEVHTR